MADKDTADLDAFVARIRACRICVEQPLGAPLPHAPRPVLQVSATARIAVCGQAPGTLAHAAARPFWDPSGVRLRAWMGVDEATFYDAARIAVVPMGFCFPGQDGKGGDLPPRRECARAWHADLFARLPGIELVLAVGSHAIRWHLPERRTRPLHETVADWRAILAAPRARRVFPLPHPSWRNNAWLKRNPWFEAELLPALRAEVAKRLVTSPARSGGRVR